MAFGERMARAYAKVRTGKLFLIILSGFCGAWVAWNILPWLPHFDDPGFGRLTLILSIEASIAASVLIMRGERQEDIQRKQALYMLHMMEALYEHLVGRNAPSLDRLSSDRVDGDIPETGEERG